MKNFVICIITIIIIIFLVAILKGINTTNYSHSNIVALINRGSQSMNNVSFDKEDSNGIVKFYYKENNWKMVAPATNTITITLENGKTYMIDKEDKNMFITTEKVLSGKRGLQDDALYIEDFNKDVRYQDKLRYEFEYIRDEKLDNKDCIFVKERKYYLDSKKYVDNTRGSEDKVPVYWIEKSTGFVIGAAWMEPGKNKATPEVIIKNIKCGEVTDDVFNDMFTLPNDYNVFEYTKDNKVKKLNINNLYLIKSKNKNSSEKSLKFLLLDALFSTTS